MKCPKCGREMKAGYVRATGNGGICYITDKRNWSAPRSDEGFIQLGKAPWLKADSIPAFNCEECKYVVIDYSGK